MENKTVSAVTHAMMANEHTSYIVQAAEGNAADHALKYAHLVFTGNHAAADACFLEMKEHHRNYMTAMKALTALAKVAVDMGLENDILPDVPPPEAE